MVHEIYLDHHSTTPVLPEVLEIMQPYFCNHFGNSASSHRWGSQAEMAVMKSKKQVADLLRQPLLSSLFHQWSHREYPLGDPRMVKEKSSGTESLPLPLLSTKPPMERPNGLKAWVLKS